MPVQDDRFLKYYKYIKNTGGSPLIECFDEDWEPIGPMVRSDMIEAGLVYEKDGRIFISN